MKSVEGGRYLTRDGGSAHKMAVNAEEWARIVAASKLSKGDR
jgi:hypothetical protein